jgi:protein-S-isoprenylcysteine O-methyltransferase Ste14
MLVLKSILGVLAQVTVFGVLLFVPAGTLGWPRALQFLAVYGAAGLIATAWLAFAAPASLEARFERPDETQPKEDRTATRLILAAFAVFFLTIPIDVFHLRPLPPPPLVVSVAGAALAAAGYAVAIVALYQNRFAAPVVKDQTDRGHVLVDTGLYGVVRHPFYTGLLVMLAGTTLWLESYLGLLACGFVLYAMVRRVRIEESTLYEELPGYPAYMERVRYRLLPAVW